MLLRRWNAEQDDLPILSADDMGSDWWGGAFQCAAGLALAVSLSATALTAQLAASPHDDSSDVPLLTIDESTWQVSAGSSVSWTIPWVATDDGGGGFTPLAPSGQPVTPFTVSNAAQLFKKVAWGETHVPPPSPLATRYDLAQPTLREQRQRIEATKQARANEKAERETMLWIASILPLIEDMDE